MVLERTKRWRKPNQGLPSFRDQQRQADPGSVARIQQHCLERGHRRLLHHPKRYSNRIVVRLLFTARRFEQVVTCHGTMQKDLVFGFLATTDTTISCY